MSDRAAAGPSAARPAAGSRTECPGTSGGLAATVPRTAPWSVRTTAALRRSSLAAAGPTAIAGPTSATAPTVTAHRGYGNLVSCSPHSSTPVRRTHRAAPSMSSWRPSGQGALVRAVAGDDGGACRCSSALRSPRGRREAIVAEIDEIHSPLSAHRRGVATAHRGRRVGPRRPGAVHPADRPGVGRRHGDRQPGAHRASPGEPGPGGAGRGHGGDRRSADRAGSGRRVRRSAVAGPGVDPRPGGADRHRRSPTPRGYRR